MNMQGGRWEANQEDLFLQRMKDELSPVTGGRRR